MTKLTKAKLEMFKSRMETAQEVCVGNDEKIEVWGSYYHHIGEDFEAMVTALENKLGELADETIT